MAARHIPLFLNYRFPVVCNGFVVGVALKGRILVEEEKDEFVAYGVNPGGIAASAGSLESALSGFTGRMHLAINDLAAVARDFPEFVSEMHDAFGTNESYEKTWKTAILAVRNGKVDLPGMTRESADIEPWIRVELIENKKPDEANFEENITLARAA